MTMPLHFQSHVLNEEQLKTARNFSPETKMLLENLETEVAEQKLRLNLKMSDVASYAQSEAFLRGKLELLRELLNPTPEIQSEEVI